MTLATSIAWLAWVGFWVAGRSASWAPEAWTSPWHPTLACVGIELVIIAIGVGNEACLRRVLVRNELALLSAPDQGGLRDEAAYGKARMDHLLQLPGLACAAVDIVFIPLALVAGPALVMMLSGGDDDLTLATLTSVLLALALSRWIAMRRSALATPMAAASKRRLSLLGQWLGRRPNPLTIDPLTVSEVSHSGHFSHIGHFNVARPTARDDAIELLEAAEAQTDLAMRDSIWQNLEALLQAHCIALPLAALAVASALRPAGPASFALAWAWAMMPIIDVALSAWRPLAGVGAAAISLQNIALGFASAPAHAGRGPVVWHEGWKLFDGSILQNVDPGGEASQLAQFLLVQLRLVDELEPASGDTASFVVEAGGRNLTASQRCRVLFARAALEAIRTRRALIIDTPMTALDRDALKHLEAAACALRVAVIWGTCDESTTAESSGTMRLHDTERANGHTVDYPAAIKRSGPLALVFALSIAGLSMLSAIVLNRESALPWHWAITTLSVATVSFALATRAGFRMERAERLQALDEHARLVALAPTCNRSWFVRRLTTDFESIIGDTTRRTRQLAWLGIATCVSVAAILWASGGTGAAAMAGVAIVGFVLHSALDEWHREASATADEGFAAFMAETDNLQRLDGLSASNADELRKKFVGRGGDCLELAGPRAELSKALSEELLTRLPSFAGLALLSTIASLIERSDASQALTAIAFASVFVVARAAEAMAREELDNRNSSRSHDRLYQFRNLP